MQQERDQQSPDPAVPVEKGVDGLELGVRQADADERRQTVRVAMQKVLQSAQGVRDFVGRRRNEDGLVERAAGGTDPILRRAVIRRAPTGRPALRARDVRESRGTGGRTGQRAQPSDPVVHGVYVVDHLGHVAVTPDDRKRDSAASTSCRELCVPSIWLDSTASLRTYMNMKRSESGSV